MSIGLTGDQAEHYMQRAIFLCFAALDTLKRLVFVSSLFDSLKVRFRNFKSLVKEGIIIVLIIIILSNNTYNLVIGLAGKLLLLV